MRTEPGSTKTDDQMIRVTIMGGLYRVDLGQTASPRFHRVSKDKTCSCGISDCAAVEAVRSYLLSGGKRAPDTADPPTCPICGGKTYRDPVWNGKYTHSLGWRCERGGLGHYLAVRAENIRRQQAENPWLIPPVPGHPGVRRDELLTWEACDAINRRIFQESGYDPTR